MKNRFFVLLTVYFVGGILFMKFGRNSTGIEMIPNLSFWKSLPGNIKVKIEKKTVINIYFYNIYK